MTKKRRQAHIPQQATRRRRPARRPEFNTGPQTPEEHVDLDGNPIFADEIPAPATAHYGTTGPVETRPHWIGSTAQGQRAPGRRTAQLRRNGIGGTGPRVLAGQLPTFASGFLADELKRIAWISGLLFAVIIVLAVVMR